MATERIDGDYRRLRGKGGPFVADVSVLPSMVRVDICNALMTIAERAAESILRRA